MHMHVRIVLEQQTKAIYARAAAMFEQFNIVQRRASKEPIPFTEHK